MSAPDLAMTGSELGAFHVALACEANPSHLFGFAAALAPDHCVAASLLHARGAILERRRSLPRESLAPLLAAIIELARSPAPPRAATNVLVRRRLDLDRFAHVQRRPAVTIYRTTRELAGALVVDQQASVGDVPLPILAFARTILLTVGPVRALDGAAIRLVLPPTVALTSAHEREERARWVRHYERENRLWNSA